jgi:hypothetical protein
MQRSIEVCFARRWKRVGFLVFVSLLITSSFLGAHTPATQAATEAVGYSDFSYKFAGVSAPTGEKPQSKLWFNDGRWWGSLFDRSTGSYYIYYLNRATQAWVRTSTRLDSRPASKADVLWDGSHLYVASGGAGSMNAVLFRFSYTATTKTYRLDSGFPVTIRNGGAETLVLNKDATGQLWITYTQGSPKKVYVNRSLGSDAKWNPAAAFVIPAAGTKPSVSADDISTLIPFSNRILVLWSNQTDSSFYYAIHSDNAADQTWTGGLAWRHPSIADDHLNIKALDTAAGNVFAAVKTSIEGASTSAPRILLLRRKLDGSWTVHTVSSGADNQTRPILLIDKTTPSNPRLYVFSSDESGGSIYYKRTGLNPIAFAPGKGTRFISSNTYTAINDATSTKQNVDSTTGLVVLAQDASKSWYLHNYMALGGTASAAPAEALNSDSVSFASQAMGTSSTERDTGQ